MHLYSCSLFLPSNPAFPGASCFLRPATWCENIPLPVWSNLSSSGARLWANKRHTSERHSGFWKPWNTPHISWRRSLRRELCGRKEASFYLVKGGLLLDSRSSNLPELKGHGGLLFCTMLFFPGFLQEYDHGLRFATRIFSHKNTPTRYFSIFPVLFFSTDTISLSTSFCFSREWGAERKKLRKNCAKKVKNAQLKMERKPQCSF